MSCLVLLLLQAGLGCILLSSDLLLSEDLLDPVPATLAALASGLAHQYFGCFLVAKGPEDTWLVDALAGWLQGAALKAVMGAAELSWHRWQVGGGVAVSATAWAVCTSVCVSRCRTEEGMLARSLTSWVHRATNMAGRIGYRQCCRGGCVCSSAPQHLRRQVHHRCKCFHDRHVNSRGGCLQHHANLLHLQTRRH
jgi:hypothetical protein